ncbi:GntR family transcriptional regulator [Alcanivorax hongdengensis A-11-3]|uniref:GntR family transcriptional regulator n=1 Tax=Alcanivorax hongdengensis A-11-3 TaxID=1177179 RepID=L0WCW4_9GAMM|nr:GntR family transcriptional regulator [Alcanivorax hongdengensis]EKF74583.1 GntR family transcriptional regulator [Alcanivorax hongdengensis A-11-3]
MSLKAISLSEQIAQHLGEQIITGTLPPGARLPENDLAKQLDVSTNSLREAFRLLEKQHMIELQPRKGARVCEVNEEQVRDLYGFLFMLLSHLAGSAAANWQPGQIEDLVEMLPQLEQHFNNDDLRAAHQLAFRFVEIATHRFARNRYLATDILDLIPLLKRYSFIALQEETSEFDVSLQIFQRLLVNVVGRKVEDAAADIREYGENQCQIVLRAIAKRNAA